MTYDQTTSNGRHTRGSSPPDLPTDAHPEQRGAAEPTPRGEQRRWVRWQAAYKVRRWNTLLKLLGPAFKARG